MERMVAAVRGYKEMKGTESSNDERIEMECNNCKRMC